MSFNKIKGRFGTVAILLISLIVSGCGGGDSEPAPAPTPIGDLLTINVTPASPILIEGLNVQLTANGNYSSGQTVEITDSVDWISSDNAIATVSATSGLVTAVSQGTATITATDSATEISATVTLTVNEASLTSITVTPTTTSIALGLNQAFVAMGNFDNGSSVDITASVTWASSDDTIATVDASGLSSSVAVGTATITASSGAISGTADLTVNAVSLTSISVTPATGTVIEGLTQAFSAMGNYNDGSSTDLTASVNWTTSDNAIATVNASGLSTGVAAGNATITATSGAISGAADLTVNAASLTSINVTPATATVIEGLTQAFVAMGNYDNGSSADITANVIWTSSDVLTATVNASGLSTGVATGSATITATSGAISGAADLTVNAASLTSINVTPATATVIEGLTQAFVAMGNYDNGSSADITASVNWTTSDNAIATVNASGLSTGVAAGSATITATSGAISGAADLTVNAAMLTSISVTPATGTVIEGLSQQFIAMGNYDNGSSVDITASVNWTTSDNAIATVNASGLSTGVAAGSATITATSGAISGAADLTVNAAMLTSITVTPATATVIEGLTQAFVAMGNYDNGSSADLTASVSWISTDTNIATVDASGLSLGVAAGTSTITATSGAISGTAELTVNAASLVSITVSPPTGTVIEGLSQAFVATGNYDNATSADLTASVVWTSSDVVIATVDASGLATGESAGIATMTATSDSILGTSELTVNAAALTSITVSPATVTVVEGLTQAFVATGNYDNATSADITASVVWTTSNGFIATVNASGLSTGVAAGTATITASSGATSATAVLTVEVASSVNDSFSINVNGAGDTVYTEAGSDPMVLVQLDQTAFPAATTSIVLAKNYIASSGTFGQTYFLGYVADTAGTLTFASGSASAVFSDTEIEFGTTNAPGSITVDSYGAVGELVVGSYDVSLCTFTDILAGTCSLVSANNYTGSFSAVRDANAGSNEAPKSIEIGLANLHHVSDLHGGINVYEVDVVAGTEYVIDVTGLSSDVLLVEYNNDAGTYASGTPGCISNNVGVTNESCTVTALGTKLYFTIGGSDSNYTVTVSEVVTGTLPDLTIAIDSVTSPFAGFLQVNYTMTNNGPADLINAALVIGGFVNPVSPPVVGNTADAISTLTGVNITSGATSTGSILVSTQATSAALYLTVDQNSVISEANESNNVSAVFNWASSAPTLVDEGTIVTPVTLDSSADLPYSGTVDTGSSYYEITGLTAAIEYNISAAIDTTGDVVLSVWTADPVGVWDTNLACVNDTTGSGTESCEIITTGTSVWVMVSGWNATPSDFILNAVEVVPTLPSVVLLSQVYDVQALTLVDISVIAGTTYTIAWDDAYDGSGTYTGDVMVNASYADATVIFFPTDSGYLGGGQTDDPQTFTAAQSGIVTITLNPTFGTGTVGLEVTSP